MAKLYFHYGAMNSGKTIELMRAAHNYEEQGKRPFVIKPATDTKGQDKITSRVGIERAVDLLLHPDADLITEVLDSHSNDPISCIFIDEAQFLPPAQVDGLFKLTIPPTEIPVMAYGLRGDFQTQGFPGSIRLMELADVIKEIRTICSCGRNATLNARMIDGEFVREGSQVAIDGEAEVAYQSLCKTCYTERVGPISSSL